MIRSKTANFSKPRGFPILESPSRLAKVTPCYLAMHDSREKDFPQGIAPVLLYLPNL